MKVLGVTSSRADYGILKDLYKKIDQSKVFDFSIIVTGSHHDLKFGNTHKEIKKDGFKKIINIKTNFSKDKIFNLTHSLSKIYQTFSIVYSKYKPKIIILLGDRFELIPFAHLAVMHNIKIIHIHGGEITDGSMDNKFRNAISAMSDFHFTSNRNSLKLLTNVYYINNVFNIGSRAINAIIKTKFLSKKKLSQSIKFILNKNFFLILVHPNTYNYKTNAEIKELILALEHFPNYHLIFISPNADPGSNIILSHYNRFIMKNSKSSILIKSLDNLTFYSLVKKSCLLIGNSSAGLIEVPSIGIPTINLGSRQKGRLLASSVINSEFQKDDIIRSIKRGVSVKYKRKIKNKIDNPYFKKNSVDLAIKYISYIKTIIDK